MHLTFYGNSVSTPEAARTGKTQRNSLQMGGRYGISVSTPHRRYGHRLRTPFLRTPFPRLLLKTLDLIERILLSIFAFWTTVFSHDAFFGIGKRGLLEKGSFQKSPFSRDSREFRDSRDSREPPDCGKQRRFRPSSRDSREFRDFRDFCTMPAPLVRENCDARNLRSASR